ncbi:MAG: hypothetical protein ACTSXJ_09415 [Candidatus Baldrarchaeia archaeon]
MENINLANSEDAGYSKNPIGSYVEDPALRSSKAIWKLELVILYTI